MFHKTNEFEITAQISSRALHQFMKTELVPQHPDWKAKVPLGALVAFWSNNRAYLCEFGYGLFQPTLYEDKLWYVSTGSGQGIADPVLGFLRTVFWGNQKPKTIADGIFAVYWALQQTIDLNPGGVGGEKHIAVLEGNSQNKPVARMLTNDEMQEHEGNYRGALKVLADYRNGFSGGELFTPPVPSLE